MPARGVLGLGSGDRVWRSVETKQEMASALDRVHTNRPCLEFRPGSGLSSKPMGEVEG